MTYRRVAATLFKRRGREATRGRAIRTPMLTRFPTDYSTISTHRPPKGIAWFQLDYHPIKQGAQSRSHLDFLIAPIGPRPNENGLSSMTTRVKRITDARGLRDIQHIVSDSWFIKSSFDYSHLYRRLRFSIWQLDFEMPDFLPILWPFRWKVVPWRRWDILITQVDEAQLTIHQTTGKRSEYELAPIIFDNFNTLEISGHMGARITAKISRLDVTLTKTNISRPGKCPRFLTVQFLG